MCNIVKVKKIYIYSIGLNQYYTLSTVWKHCLVSTKSRFKVKNGSIQIETQDQTNSNDIYDPAIADISVGMHYKYHEFYYLESFNLFKYDGKTISI